MASFIFSGEQCAGCGVYAEAHPIVGVTSADDLGKLFFHFPVCKKCHEDPSNRQRVLKASFFERKDRELAVRLAGERDKAGNPVLT